VIELTLFLSRVSGGRDEQMSIYEEKNCWELEQALHRSAASKFEATTTEFYGEIVSLVYGFLPA
jgi:hypothetical protein